MRWHLLAVGLLPLLVTPAVQAQNLTSQPESTIVITVRDFKASDPCGNRFSFPRPGNTLDSFDFPHPGQAIGFSDFPRPGGVTNFSGIPTETRLVRYFQLPAASPNPDIVGCLDTRRNVLFITIKSQQRQETVPAPAAPAPQPAPATQPVLGTPPFPDRPSKALTKPPNRSSPLFLLYKFSDFRW